MTSFQRQTYKAPQAPSPLPIAQAWALLGGISPERFMEEYWQKKPLLVKGAIPAFGLAKAEGIHLDSPISMTELAQIANNKHVESRLIKSSPWSLSHGPLKPKQIPALHEPKWTLLVQGMNQHHQAAQTVMSWFRFIPEARLDDLMISIAGPGGGVGPHMDSYDVFLIQMAGRRHWKISIQEDVRLKEGLPLKILKNFKPTHDWILEPGDMLYLPPNIAHDGVALDSGCQTWSVGFRVPQYKELISEILWRTTEALEADEQFNALYQDPKQKATLDAGKVPQTLIEAVSQKLQKIRWSKSDISCTLASLLSEPKPQVYFERPRSILDLSAFKQALSQKGIALAPQSKALHDKEYFYLNGENLSDKGEKDWEFWIKLSKNQVLNHKDCKKLIKTITDTDNPWFEAYCSGWICLT